MSKAFENAWQNRLKRLVDNLCIGHPQDALAAALYSKMWLLMSVVITPLAMDARTLSINCFMSVISTSARECDQTGEHSRWRWPPDWQRRPAAETSFSPNRSGTCRLSAYSTPVT